jgi:hypothetical protein
LDHDDDDDDDEEDEPEDTESGLLSSSTVPEEDVEYRFDLVCEEWQQYKEGIGGEAVNGEIIAVARCFVKEDGTTKPWTAVKKNTATASANDMLLRCFDTTSAMVNLFGRTCIDCD